MSGAALINHFKAFHAIGHSGLLSKLSFHGICDTGLKLPGLPIFFLKLTVQYNGVLSEPNPVFTEIPQRSILGPLLFIIHYDDVNKPLQLSRIITCADGVVNYLCLFKQP